MVVVGIGVGGRAKELCKAMVRDGRGMGHDCRDL